MRDVALFLVPRWRDRTHRWFGWTEWIGLGTSIVFVPLHNTTLRTRLPVNACPQVDGSEASAYALITHGVPADSQDQFFGRSRFCVRVNCWRLTTFRTAAMHLVNRLSSWLEGLSGGTWIVLQSVLALAAVSGANVIVNELSRHHGWAARVALVAVLILGAVAYFWVALVAARIRDRIFPKHPSTVLALQRELGDALASENQLIAEHRGRTKKQRHAEGMAIFMHAVQRAISQQWSEARFGSATETEVVLMTKSLRDDQMTCASWAVRRPYSLANRENDPTVYTETEAARMYREADRGRVGTRLIADTVRPGSDYEFLNQSESERIRSTVLHPVYDPSSELIGVIVAHTNRPNVFRPEDKDFWTALLRLVEPHVARRIILARTEDWSGDPPW